MKRYSRTRCNIAHSGIHSLRTPLNPPDIPPSDSQNHPPWGKSGGGFNGVGQLGKSQGGIQGRMQLGKKSGGISGGGPRGCALISSMDSPRTPPLNSPPLTFPHGEIQGKLEQQNQQSPTSDRKMPSNTTLYLCECGGDMLLLLC